MAKVHQLHKNGSIRRIMPQTTQKGKRGRPSLVVHGESIREWEIRFDGGDGDDHRSPTLVLHRLASVGRSTPACVRACTVQASGLSRRDPWPGWVRRAVPTQHCWTVHVPSQRWEPGGMSRLGDFPSPTGANASLFTPATVPGRSLQGFDVKRRGKLTYYTSKGLSDRLCVSLCLSVSLSLTLSLSLSLSLLSQFEQARRRRCSPRW